MSPFNCIPANSPDLIGKSRFFNFLDPLKSGCPVFLKFRATIRKKPNLRGFAVIGRIYGGAALFSRRIGGFACLFPDLYFEIGQIQCASIDGFPPSISHIMFRYCSARSRCGSHTRVRMHTVCMNIYCDVHQRYTTLHKMVNSPDFTRPLVRRKWRQLSSNFTRSTQGGALI